MSAIFCKLGVKSCQEKKMIVKNSFVRMLLGRASRKRHRVPKFIEPSPEPEPILNPCRTLTGHALPPLFHDIYFFFFGGFRVLC